jgi:hypothetical protein
MDLRNVLADHLKCVGNLLVWVTVIGKKFRTNFRTSKIIIANFYQQIFITNPFKKVLQVSVCSF